MQYQFHQATFKVTPPAVVTPIKYDYVRDTRTTNAGGEAPTRSAQAPSAPRNNFDREMPDTQMGEADTASRTSIDEMETGGMKDLHI